MREVATRAGVSIATVSNVLNRPHLVAEPTRVESGKPSANSASFAMPRRASCEGGPQRW